MDNRQDHIEDSIRKAFEGFELPVSDTDWTAIATGLEKSNQKRGLWTWLKKRIWMLALILILTSAGLYGLFQQDSKPVAIGKTELSAEQNYKEQTQNGKPTVENNTSQEKATNTAPNTNGRAFGGESTQSGSRVALSGGITATAAPVNPGNPDVTANSSSAAGPGTSPAPMPVPQEIPVPPVNSPETKPQPETVSIWSNWILKALGISVSGISDPWWSSILQKTKKSESLSNGKPRSIKPYGLEIYALTAIQLDRGKAQTTASNSEPWKFITWNSYRNPQVHVRLETGISYRSKKWSAGIGAAFEQSASTRQSSDTIRVKIPTQFLPYITLQNDTIWLARKWRDSTIVLGGQPTASWLELPMSFAYRFDLKNQFRLTAGISLNPGILAGSGGQMVNPYAFTQSGSYWKYYYGNNTDTLSRTVSPKSFMNSFRIGNGLTLGIEKDMGRVNWGVQATGRYYYTPVWKPELPLKQHTFNYGINFRIGIKL